MSESDELIAQSHLELEARIRKRAHELWLKRRQADQGDGALEDWLQAEREVLGENPKFSAQSRGDTVGPGFKPDTEPRW